MLMAMYMWEDGSTGKSLAEGASLAHTIKHFEKHRFLTLNTEFTRTQAVLVIRAG
jgi:hypothetical protein